ncbi:hypothetical protein BGZ60DRAFT_434810 [Tricladium varicosporioides]|nr:hypothetical protein BGZ60DRAFT_434810 [Hymenoscyphus varicosporioides]
MANDNAITQLLYAILSQKCLKDIDWNQVARHPVHTQEITNGHAARMRYSRFKKQMDGTKDIVRKQKNPASPRKNRVEKKQTTKKEKVKKDRENDDAETFKQEREDTVESEPGTGLERSMVVKSEPSEHESRATPSPYTPLSQTHPHSHNSTPSPSQSQQSFGPLGAGMGDMDDMMHSFGVPSLGDGGGGIYTSMMSDGFEPSMGMGMQMAMTDPFENLWHQETQEQHAEHAERHDRTGNFEEGYVNVKTEPRWEEAYRHT